MYVANARETTKKITQRGMIDMLTQERKWNHTKFSKKKKKIPREGRKKSGRQEKKLRTKTMKR